ncbi:hypothetical protein PSECIP111951_00994 [Pseudoalteromonas holothuriae]|uniref:BioF2-like acetyltransferase domain-containing protein n=1 Tax=Pseudoalteromonas holothuriae TaxID=2963714 RepID=A0ABN8ULM0_9GAMM|nr:GNAT family N-acetyltransferase [Pseudoalteromonas sp. CIP111951]CAH9054252.1 hypothetical protein PSECIP111951_00994 [Pseudoalteromonas sp. CIP111951]
MTFELSDWLKQYVQNANMDVRFNDKVVLEEFIRTSGCSVIDHYTWMSDYHKEYLASQYDKVQCASLLLQSNGKVAGVFTINVRQTENSYELGSSSAEVLPPFIEQTLSRKVKHKLYKQCFNLLLALSDTLSIKNLASSFDFQSGICEPWYNLFLQYGAKINVSQNLFCDLTMSSDAYLNAIRERYKNHIKRADKLWNISIKTQINWQDFYLFQQLHLDVAGFKTRSDLSWEMLYQAVNRQDAFVVIVLDQSNNLVGAALFTVSNEVATYSVGVYDRSLFASPVSHLVHYRAIEKMRDLGIKTYFIGAKNALNEWHQPSEKESKIGEFKEGFATFSLLKTHLSIELK